MRPIDLMFYPDETFKPTALQCRALKHLGADSVQWFHGPDAEGRAVFEVRAVIHDVSMVLGHGRSIPAAYAQMSPTLKRLLREHHKRTQNLITDLDAETV